MITQKDYYQILNIPSTASQEEVRRSYLTLVKIFHPDKFDPVAQKAEYEKATSLMKDLIEANNVLSNSASRLRYDSERSFSPSAEPKDGVPPPAPNPPTPPPQRSKPASKGKRAASEVTGTLIRIFHKFLVIFAIVFWGGMAIAVVSVMMNSTNGYGSTKKLTSQELEQQHTTKVFQSTNEILKNTLIQQNTKSTSLMPSIKEVQFPQHGTMYFYTDEERIAGLKLDTPGGNLYLVILREASSGKKIATI